MISQKYRCIFIEVPKTGSTSIRAVLGHPQKPHLDILQTKRELECMLQLSYLYDRPDDVWDPIKPKRTAELMFEQFFKFGFVRNPWDRTVSLYERKEGIQLSGKMTFEEFVEWINYSSDTCIHPTRHKNQLDWFTDHDGRVLVDFIGRFERLQDDWKKVCEKLGLQMHLPYTNQNLSRKKQYTEYYTTKTMGLVASKFRVDIEYFGYEFGKQT
jgi:hypothetical protein